MLAALSTLARGSVSSATPEQDKHAVHGAATDPVWSGSMPEEGDLPDLFYDRVPDTALHKPLRVIEPQGRCCSDSQITSHRTS